MRGLGEIIDEAIAVAEIVAEKDPQRFHVARKFLVALLDELSRHAPDDPSVDKLRAYLRRSTT